MHRANSVRHAECSSSSHQPNSSLHQFADKLGRSSQMQSANDDGDGLRRTGGPSVSSADRATKKPPLATKSNELNRDSSSQQDYEHLQAGAEQQVYMKSCLSDGDFNEILIKVNDHQDQESDKQPSSYQRLPADYTSSFPEQNKGSAGLECELEKTRRRSSCSDADDPKSNL